MMRKIGLIGFLLLVCLSVWAAPAAEIFSRATVLVKEEVARSPQRMESAGETQAIPVTLSGRRSGALAEYRASTDEIVFFKSPITRWLKTVQKQLSEQEVAAQLARCLAPLYIHELSHAQDAHYAKRQGFVWPVTVEDEWVASFWQLAFMRAMEKQDPAYYQPCQWLMPPASYRDLPPCEAQAAVYQAYTRAAGRALPPPLHLSYYEELVKHGKIHFAGNVFMPRNRRLSLRNLWSKGGNWMQLTPSALAELPQDRAYQIVQQWRTLRLREIHDYCNRP